MKQALSTLLSLIFLVIGSWAGLGEASTSPSGRLGSHSAISTPTTLPPAKQAGEHIAKYDIHIVIEQSGELAVTETVTYSFGSLHRHGIYRDIPHTIKTKAHFKDLGLSDFSVTMDGKSISWQQSTHRDENAGKVVRLKIGDPRRTITGMHRYTIRYRVTLGVLPSAQDSSLDAVRWNTIGTGWRVPIYDITTKVTLPNALHPSQIKYADWGGAYGSTDAIATSRWVGNQLHFHTDKLNPHEGLTVELAFPTKLLDQSGSKNVEPTTWEWFLGFWHWGALAGFGAYFFSVYRRNTGFKDNRSVAVQYEPPNGLSLLQSGLILDKNADNKDFAAAVLELGQLGYLTIAQKSSGSAPILKRTDKLTDGLSRDQKYLLEKLLFKDGDSFELKSRSATTSSLLQTGFGVINDKLYDWSVADGYMTENPKRLRSRYLWGTLAALVPVLILAIVTLMMKTGPEAVALFGFASIFVAAGVSVAVSMKGLFGKVFGFVFAALGSLPPLIISGTEYGYGVISFIFGPFGMIALLIAAMVYVYLRIGRFTQKGAYAHKKLLGLEEFVGRVKEDEIKRFLDRDPLYLDKMLPYALLFGQLKHWLKFYEAYNVDTPYWYHGNMSNFGNFQHSMTSAATPPSSGGSGYSGGGGFSGGGGGGGGGGSW